MMFEEYFMTEIGWFAAISQTWLFSIRKLFHCRFRIEFPVSLEIFTYKSHSHISELNMKSFVLIFVAIYLKFVFGDGILSIKKFQCTINSKYIYPNFSCFPKSYSRNVSTGNVAVFLRKPVFEAFVSFSLFFWQF